MAKKVERKAVSTKATTESNIEDDIRDIAAIVNKQFGEGSAMIMGEETSDMLEIPFWTRTGIPQLDYAIGGYNHPGVPGGRIIEIFGPESNGKTTLAMWILKRLIDDLNGIGIYQDSEHAFSEERASQMRLNMSKVIFSQPETMESVFEAQEVIIDTLSKKNSDRPIGIVWDSIAATPTKSEVDGDYGDAVMGIHARIMSQALRKITSLIKKDKVCAMYINQVRDKMNVSWGEKTDTFGGRAMKFYSTVRIEVVRIETLKKGNDKMGIKVRATIKKNKVAPPFKEATFNILFDEDSGVIDWQTALLDFLKDNNFIGGSSGWYEIKGKNYRPDEARKLLSSDEDLTAELYAMAYNE